MPNRVARIWVIVDLLYLCTNFRFRMGKKSQNQKKRGGSPQEADGSAGKFSIPPLEPISKRSYEMNAAP